MQAVYLTDPAAKRWVSIAVMGSGAVQSVQVAARPDSIEPEDSEYVDATYLNGQALFLVGADGMALAKGDWVCWGKVTTDQEVIVQPAPGYLPVR